MFRRSPGNLVVQLLVICILLITPFRLSINGSINLNKARAKTFKEVPNGWESYLNRPDIFEIKAEPQNLGDNWEKLKAAHFSFVAELLSIYPENTHIYFLARDAELLFDVAKIITEGTSASDRIHLLNISRGNMLDENLQAYLAENDISEQSLLSGKKVLFVDTGFAGTIPQVIAKKFSLTAQRNLKTHLICSENKALPSSRSFLVHLNPAANDFFPSGMHSTIVTYEHIPKYSDRSSRLLFISDRIHPISPINQTSDGGVSKETNQRYRSDLKFSWHTPKVQQLFHDEIMTYEYLMRIFRNRDTKALQSLKSQINAPPSLQSRMLKSKVLDIIESSTNLGLNFSEIISFLNLEDTPTNLNSNSTNSKKILLKESFPEWTSILENPEDEITKLFIAQDWQTIGSLIDANIDDEINKLLADLLFDSPATGIREELQKNFIKKADRKLQSVLAEFIFSRPQSKMMSDLLSLLIKKNDQVVLALIAKHVFSQPHTKNMTAELKLLIERAKPDSVTAIYLAKFVFSQPHTKDMSSLLTLLVKKRNRDLQRNLITEVLSKPHARNFSDAIKTFVEMKDQNLYYNLARSVFTRPHSRNMIKLLKTLIENTTDASVLNILRSHTFQQPHLRGSIEFEVLRKSLDILDQNKRKEYLTKEFPNSNLTLVERTSDLSPISPSLKIGDIFVVQNRLMKIIDKSGQGKRGVVFKVQAQDSGEYYALKVAINSSQETLASIKNESMKAAIWRQLKLEHAEVLVQEKDFVLKTWIVGTSGEEVIKKYLSGDKKYKKAADSILKLVSQIREKGAYVGDFRPANLIWSNNRWVIIDSGSIQQDLTLGESHSKWSQVDQRGPKFERRWNLVLPALKSKTCSSIF